MSVEERTSRELVELAASAKTKGQAQQAEAELLRRNTEALRESNKAAQKQSSRVLFLTVVLLTIALTEFVLGVLPENENVWVRYVLTLCIGGSVLYFLNREINKDEW